jgi:hypothetical protein
VVNVTKEVYNESGTGMNYTYDWEEAFVVTENDISTGIVLDINIVEKTLKDE